MTRTRPKVRDDLLYYPDPEDENRRFVKDPIRRQFFKYNALQVEMMKALDGKRTIDEVKAYLEEKFDAEVPAAGITRFVARLESQFLLDFSSYTIDDETTRKRILKELEKRGLALRVRARDNATEEAQLFQAATTELHQGDPCKAGHYFQRVLELNPNNERARQMLIATQKAFFKTKYESPDHAKLVHLLNPDPALRAIDKVVGRFVFSWWGGALLLAIVLSGFWPGIFVYSQPAVTDGLSVFDVVMIIVLSQGLAFFHELCHGLACAHYGGTVDDMGFMFMYGSIYPANYCDTTDTYIFKGKRPKIVVQFAGPLGALAFQSLNYWFLALTDTSFPLWQALAIANALALFGNYMSVIPFVKFDAYYALSEHLSVSNLYERSTDYVRGRLSLWFFGINPCPMDVSERERRLFLFFGITAATYTTLWTYGLFLSLFLPTVVKHFGTFGLVLTAYWLFKQLFRPLYRKLRRLVRFLRKHYREIFTVRRSAAYVGAAGALVLALTAPWPLYVDGTLFVEPLHNAEVRALEGGLVIDVRVEEGQHVSAGDVIAVLRSDALVRDHAIAEQELQIANSRLTLLREGARQEQVLLAEAHARAGEVRSAAASRRASDARMLRQLGADTAHAAFQMTAVASAAHEQSRVIAAETSVVTAGSRQQEIDEAEADVRRHQARVNELAFRIGNLTVRAPISGIIASRRPLERYGTWAAVGALLANVHDVSRWRGRIVPDRGEPLQGLAAGQKVVLAASGAPDAKVETTISEILPPQHDSTAIIYTAPVELAAWRSGMSGQAKIYAPKRTVAYRLFVLPLARLVEHEIPSI